MHFASKSGITGITTLSSIFGCGSLTFIGDA